ncbi:hypothetical protein JXA80_11635 [bacterium]|nr:hypothetical protein [candidate division CSSED10-310 bacterium]
MKVSDHNSCPPIQTQRQTEGIAGEKRFSRYLPGMKDKRSRPKVPNDGASEVERMIARTVTRTIPVLLGVPSEMHKTPTVEPLGLSLVQFLHEVIRRIQTRTGSSDSQHHLAFDIPGCGTLSIQGSIRSDAISLAISGFRALEQLQASHLRHLERRLTGLIGISVRLQMIPLRKRDDEREGRNNENDSR